LGPGQRKTPRSERTFGAHLDVILQHTDSGSATGNLSPSYIEWLHRDIAQGYPATLILDVYPTHRTDLVFQTVTANDVELLFVPAGATRRFQPMDRRIFGELKACARAEFGRRRWLSGRTDIGYDESVSVPASPGKNVRNIA
jgi:lysophospholipase L1-like esterase